MSVSAGVNVLRWSALGFGIFYGISHQASITAKDKLAAINKEYKHKEELISQAKAEFAKKNAPPAAASTSGIITDPSDPKFDLEALVKQQETATK
ncbi:hypothetical protein NA57DRAFT_75163 [Rhizodiscina lignyota]|uniref:ATP synthase F(0) complex subunit e, mitochondrial n=1 Tax=Rhizodiscina lignyota TaxID=1504668 RepID=A0A9P4II14_9PEZI|nr:hypothetical protein NA57DRAFT_75163 [Rhizodiscina lignyota]